MSQTTTNADMTSLFRVRTITCFVSLQASDFVDNADTAGTMTTVDRKIAEAAHFLHRAQKRLEQQNAGWWLHGPNRSNRHQPLWRMAAGGGGR